MKFNIGQKVRIKHSSREGVVMGISVSLHDFTHYKVQLDTGDSEGLEAWWHEGFLEELTPCSQ